MAGLYGDLPQAKVAAGEAPAAWGAPKLQPTKKPTILAPPPSLLRGRGGGGRTPGGGRGGGRAGAISTATATPDSSDGSVLQGSTTTAATIFLNVKEEYDPMRPNDYEQVLKERERARREAEAEVERVARLKEMEAAMEKLKREEEGPVQSEGTRAAMLNISGAEAYARRGQASSTGFSPAAAAAAAAPEDAGMATGGLGLGAGLGAAGAAAAAGGDKASDKGMSLAQKMLMKMGWKEGEGLGRERQGISTPLVMQKTNARAGVIVNAEPIAGPKRQGAQIVGQPSRVLCLRNMVGPGEVDAELEEEVGIECTKYGTVTSVLIFEVTQPGCPPEEAVRIFVQFERMESAMKALVDLQGRFFGGREVRCAFFSEERFSNTQLAPMAGEFD